MGSKINLKKQSPFRVRSYMEPIPREDWTLLERRSPRRDLSALTFSPNERMARGLAVYGSSSSRGGGMKSLDVGSPLFDPDTQTRYEMLLKALEEMGKGEK